MKIIVTGGAGFIGSQVADSYLARGHQVIVVDNLATGFKQHINKEAEHVNLDICSPSLLEVFDRVKPDVVNHHAAQINLRKSVEDPTFDARVNILGLINLMQAAVASKSVKRIIFASTGGAIYGDAEIIPTPEDYSAWPVSPYGIAKLTGEHYLYYYSTNYNLPFISLRYGNVYGPRQNPHGEAGVVAIFTEALLSGKNPVINGDGRQTRDFVFVDDVIKANLLVLGSEVHGTFNISTGKETDVNTIFENLAKITDSQISPQHAPAKIGEQKRSALDCSKAKQQLGWVAQTSLEEGLRKTVKYFQNR